ncbi:MAG: hypothetical protein HOF35_02930 [Bacteroidetes bacterium]|jgi:hypothetical protein|nr:hypothetical protein [Bacteroidota bacterium]
MLRNILSIIIGLFIGGVVNMGLILIGPSIIPPPPGMDVTDADSIGASIHLFQTKHFVFPFLAHALGTFAGALVAFIVTKSHKDKLPYLIGLLFLAGGISASFMIPAPISFIVIDLVVAYLPMAWLAIRLGKTFQITQ